MSDQEEWRAVVGWEGLYSVSSEGRVRTEGRGGGRTPGRILKASPGAVGYRVVTLWKQNKSKVQNMFTALSVKRSMAPLRRENPTFCTGMTLN